jgi:excisionase family DNA binding protein
VSAQSPASEKRPYTVDQVAYILGVARGTAYEAIRRKEIPSIRIGRRILVPRAKFDAMLGEDE